MKTGGFYKVVEKWDWAYEPSRIYVLKALNRRSDMILDGAWTCLLTDGREITIIPERWDVYETTELLWSLG